MTEREFWETDPATFQDYIRRWRIKIHRDSHRFAELMALIANCNRKADSEVFTASDFLRTPSGRRTRPRRKKQSAAFVTQLFESLVAQGTVIKESV